MNALKSALDASFAKLGPWAMAGFLLLGASPVTHADILGVSFSGAAYDINSATGSGVSIGSNGGFNALAVSPGGTVWGASTSNLWSINPLTGAGTVGPAISGMGGISIRGLAFSPGGQLFAINNGGAASSTSCCDDLFRIDVATGNATLVGSTGFAGIQALAYGSGMLYGWEVGSSGVGAGLITLSISTGAGTDVNLGMGGSSGDIQGLAFSPQGILYGARDALYTVNTSTGAITLIGSGGYSDVRGIEFTSAVPEPETYAMLLAGLGLLGFAARRRK